MEYLGEAVALGIDTLVFGICCRFYLRRKRAVDSIKDAPTFEINSDLEKFIQKQPNERVRYCAIRGTVLSLGSPIHSINAKDIKGVIQKLSIKQHVVTRSTAGFWAEHERTIQEVYNVIPFAIQQGTVKVEVLDALTADILDLDTIADQFEPSNPSLSDHLWGFFSGVRQRGLQSTEEMLRQGALITSIGELTVDSNGKGLQIQPPSDGTPYYLTTLPLSSLVRRLDEDKRLFRTLTIILGGVGIILTCMLARRWWIDRAKKIVEEIRRKNLEATRIERRRQARDTHISNQNLCVVCKENPKEIILLPCGHVCLCEDCSEGIQRLCPVCRTPIERRAAAYL